MNIKIILIALAIIGVSTALFSFFYQKKASKATSIIQKAVKAHGGKNYEKGGYSFIFRDRTFTFQHQNGRYEYTKTENKDANEIYDVLNNEGFQRSINGETQTLSEEDAAKYGGSLTSVIYFVLLPYKLQDPAVMATYKGETTIKNTRYEVIEVRFEEEGGGEDHEDIYYYWINAETHTMDYLAYKFLVNGGGVRFREAFHPRVVNGVRFQDYVNYKADYETDLASLPVLFENGKLEKLSEVKTELVAVMKQ